MMISLPLSTTPRTMAPPLVFANAQIELRDGRGRRQHRLVFQQLGFGLADAVEGVLSDVHGVISGTVESRSSSGCGRT